MQSGEKDSQTISKIISANRGLAKYFENFLVICERIYTGDWLNNIMINEQFSCLTVGALIEILSLNMPLLLVELGDNNSMFSADLQQNEPEWMKRRVTYELCMISANFTCAVCKLIFDTTTELKVHI